MAQRYLAALDYADYNARQILRKHAKKRPLGEIELRHRYTPAQPVLSCRTVDIDVSGTRTYRPKSTTDIIQEQHRLIHTLYTKRPVASAPPRRNVPAQSNRKVQRINIQVTGQPLSNQSQTSLPNRKKLNTRKPKLNVRAKSAPSCKVVRWSDDQELLMTSRSTKALTSKIHQQWQPENHDLSSGVFVRGQSKSEAPPSLDTWLTFGGSAIAGETPGGIIDAFAQFKDCGDFYSVEGGVGSRIAQQLQKGDRVRIGINGRPQTHHIKLKHQNLSEEIIEEEPNTQMERKPVVPLCWDDQVNNPRARVISPRSQNNDQPRPSLCETHPVIFSHPEENKSRPKLASPSHEGYRVRQRPKSGPGLDGHDQQNKIVVLSIDPSDDEDQLQSLTVDDVLKHSISAKNSSKQEASRKESSPENSESAPVDSMSEPDNTDRSPSKTSGAESQVSSNSEPSKSPRFKAVTPSFTVQPYSVADLTVGPPSGSFVRSQSELSTRSVASSRPGSDRSLSRNSDRASAKLMYKPSPSKPIRVSSPAAFSVYGTKGETEFIQISTQIRNPNPRENSANKNSENFITQTASEEAIRQVTKQNKVEERGTPRITPAPASSPEPLEQQATPVAINIPTAEDFCDRDSVMASPWPTNSHNKEVEKITTLMEDTAVERETSQKSVKFRVEK
uniref:Uncharacterized protein LOC111120617 n=1 Tax=Crassostrea virginica TaxID=6565 RepID=A0A8B8CPQ9_CRAVI|nr:uncharacterized protein LOC111120617 [Crassostrea virginica]XP_022317175.1 uncharacterized protein LOC111120617 [Crassostrea virginica]XP_022317176.1 uncharacterized protein LOC111120617 [Crassostrea virginica]